MRPKAYGCAVHHLDFGYIILWNAVLPLAIAKLVAIALAHVKLGAHVMIAIASDCTVKLGEYCLP